MLLNSNQNIERNDSNDYYSYHDNERSNSNSDGWILYYSPEGYPYYYNEHTGESQWAEYEDSQNQDPDEELDQNRNKNSRSRHNYNYDEENDYEENEGNEEDNDGSLQNYSDDESVGTEEYEEQEFQEYLQSEAGRLAYEDEKRRLEEYFNSKQMTEQQLSEDEEEEEEGDGDGDEDDYQQMNPRYQQYNNQYNNRTSRMRDDEDEEEFENNRLSNQRDYRQNQQNQQRQQQQQQYYNQNQQEYNRNNRHNGYSDNMMYPSNQMTSQQVSQFISTYGLPPPPNKFSPRRSKYQGMEGAGYNPPGSGMATPRGMKIGRRQESLGPDIEGGELDDAIGVSSPSPSNNNSKKSKKSKRKELNVIPEDEQDPDLQIIKEPVVPVWVSSILLEIYNRLLRMPAVYVLQLLINSSNSTLSNPVLSSSIDDSLQLSDIIPTFSTNNNNNNSNNLKIETVTYPLTISSLGESAWNYLNDTAKYIVEGGLQTASSSNNSQSQNQEEGGDDEDGDVQPQHPSQIRNYRNLQQQQQQIPP